MAAPRGPDMASSSGMTTGSGPAKAAPRPTPEAPLCSALADPHLARTVVYCIAHAVVDVETLASPNATDMELIDAEPEFHPVAVAHALAIAVNTAAREGATIVPPQHSSDDETSPRQGGRQQDDPDADADGGAYVDAARLDVLLTAWLDAALEVAMAKGDGPADGTCIKTPLGFVLPPCSGDAAEWASDTLVPALLWHACRRDSAQGGGGATLLQALVAGLQPDTKGADNDNALTFIDNLNVYVVTVALLLWLCVIVWLWAWLWLWLWLWL